MNPAPTDLIENPIQVKRRIWCQSYDTCLNIAIYNGWNGFDCNGCQDYQQLQWDDLRWFRDAQACAELLRFVAYAPKNRMKNYRIQRFYL